MGESDDQEMPKACELPLSLWLRGDEVYFDEFSLDADSVMDKLGIKRSRLRQISGHELRVGRKRMDRYTRPFYRPQDVQDYLDWTRPTASHQKSSRLLNSAAENLSSQSQVLNQKLDSVETSVSQQVSSLIRLSRELNANVNHCHSQIIAQIRQFSKSQVSQISLDRHTKDLTQIRSQWQQIKSSLDDLSRTGDIFVEALGLIQSNHQTIVKLQLCTDNWLKEFPQVLDNFHGRLDDIVAKLDHHSQVKPHRPHRRRTIRHGGSQTPPARADSVLQPRSKGFFKKKPVARSWQHLATQPRSQL